MLAPMVLGRVRQGWDNGKGRVVPCVTPRLLRNSSLGSLAQPAAGSGGWGVWHHLAWQVTVWAQAPSCPAGASLSPHPVPIGGVLAGQLRERVDRKELLSFIVPSPAGSDSNSFLPPVSGLAVGPMAQGCSHRAAAQCSEGMVRWCCHWGGSDPWAVLAAEGP